jgi:hypothetical protein
MFLSVAVLSTGMRKCHWVVPWFFVPPTEALVPWQVTLRIAVVALRTSPAVKSLLDLVLILSFDLLIRVIHAIVVRSFLFLLVFFDILVRVQLVDPPLNAPQVEWVVALLAVPDGRPLVDRVRADTALLSRQREAFYKVFALLGKVVGAADEILGVVLDRGLALFLGALTFLDYFDFVVFFCLGTFPPANMHSKSQACLG